MPHPSRSRNEIVEARAAETREAASCVAALTHHTSSSNPYSAGSAECRYDWLTPYYQSAMIFSTLGDGEIDPKGDPVGEACTMVEALLGIASCSLFNVKLAQIAFPQT